MSEPARTTPEERARAKAIRLKGDAATPEDRAWLSGYAEKVKAIRKAGLLKIAQRAVEREAQRNSVGGGTGPDPAPGGSPSPPSPEPAPSPDPPKEPPKEPESPGTPPPIDMDGKAVVEAIKAALKIDGLADMYCEWLATSMDELRAEGVTRIPKERVDQILAGLVHPAASRLQVRLGAWLAQQGMDQESLDAVIVAAPAGYVWLMRRRLSRAKEEGRGLRAA